MAVVVTATRGSASNTSYLLFTTAARLLCENSVLSYLSVSARLSSFVSMSRQIGCVRLLFLHLARVAVASRMLRQHSVMERAVIATTTRNRHPWQKWVKEITNCLYRQRR